MLQSRKKYSRIPLKSIFLFKIADKALTCRSLDLIEIEAPPSIDVNSSGMKLISNKKMIPGTFLDMIISFSPEIDPIEVLGRVVWNCPANKSNEYDTGIEFVDLEAKERMILEKSILVDQNHT